MTEKAKRQDRGDAGEDRERLSSEMSREQAPERAEVDDLTRAATTESDVTAAGNETTPAVSASPRPRQRRTTRKATIAQADKAEATAPNAQDQLELSALEADANELLAQGFSPEEAQRLIDISKRLETSAEARASQAELKRLRFAQWLIEHGILDEFSA